MFKWPNSPSPRSPKHELADFAELNCWQNKNTSATALSRMLGRLEENDYSGGVPEEDETDESIVEAYVEIERRQNVCGGDYPFAIGGEGLTLRAIPDDRSPSHLIYKFLLLATRLNMNSQRCHAGIDGTQLFEELAAGVAKEYFGARAESLVFGARPDDANFGAKVDYLCGQLQEGGGFANGGSLRGTRAGDGKLDIVVWKPFADGLPGKLIGFGQCKTGTSYQDSTAQLQPSAFRDKWMRNPLVVLPVRMFFVAEALALSEDDRSEIAIDAGLLFDRCRIVDFCAGIEDGVLGKVRNWTAAAAETAELP